MPANEFTWIWGLFTILCVMLVFAVLILSIIVAHSKKIGKSEEKFRILFGRVFDGLILLDLGGTIIDLNDSAGVLIGYPNHELVGQPLDGFINAARIDELYDGFQKVFHGGAIFLGEFEMIRNDGKVIHTEIGCTSLEIREQRYILASIRDVTDRIIIEQKLREKNIALSEVLYSLEEEKSKIKKQISNTVDHVLLPTLDKMLNDDGSVNKPYFDALKEGLLELASLSGNLGDVMTKLTPRELEICRHTQNGYTAKDIGRLLNITPATVEKHKERIRKKLKISNTKKNLASHLKRISRSDM